MGVLAAVFDLAGPARCAGCRRRGDVLCDGCRPRVRRAASRTIAPVDHLVAPWHYSGAARSLILELKLRGRREAAAPLAEAMCRAVAERGLAASVVTWVPGRGADVRRRGFDHAEVLARSVATLLGLPVARCLERSGRTLDQAGLSATERWHNLEGAFVAGSAVSRPVVVDDVVTTGATIRSCALALVAGGAEHVDALVACCA